MLGSRRRIEETLAHYRAGDFERARRVRGLPLSDLMVRFGGEPYRIDWHGEREAVLPFLQESDWELPTVEIEIDGETVHAWIDTGGDTLTLPHAYDVEPLARFSGTFAGVYGRVEEVRLGPVTVRAVPVMTGGFERPVIGTSFLSRFLPTLDYPGGRLVLRPRGAEPGDGVPFEIASTHLLLAGGALNDVPMTFLVDSGLCDEHGAAFTAPAATLAAAGIPLPETAPERGGSGAGEVTLELGRFPIERLALGPLVQHDLLGLYGAFPAGLDGIDGLISHHFLRRYRWTLDFTRMTMRFAP